MRRVMAEAMEDGAFGVSYALIYPPDAFVDTDEIVEVCKVVGAHGGIYITHMRSEADTLLEALDEAIEIGRRARRAGRDLPPEGGGRGATGTRCRAAIEQIERGPRGRAWT